MNISVRLYTILHKHGIENIADMSNYTSDDIIRWKDIGRRSLEELLSTMKAITSNLKENKITGGKQHEIQKETSSDRSS